MSESLHQIEGENICSRQELSKGPSSPSIAWGECPAIQQVLRLIEVAAPTNTTVLIQGECGSGKETVARAIFKASKRVDKPFIAVNCAMAQEKSLEIELFGEETTRENGQGGHVQGGLKMAEGGTLFLEEVSDLPLALQGRLVRVLQENQVHRNDGSAPTTLDVRLIVGTRRNLKSEVARERFREDLFYLVSMFPIEIPPLRDRGEDIMVISQTFLEQLMRKHGKKISDFTPVARTKMLDYSWPGNLRELVNVLERAVILVAPGAPLAPDDLFLQGVARNNLNLFTSGVLPTIDQMEQRLIGLMLKQTDNNKSKAAKKLGISIRTMRNKLLRYKAEGINIDDTDNLPNN